MATDLSSIRGNVYTDLTENGLTGDDTDLANVTVWLYRDGAGTPGAGTFQSGGGVAGGNDVLIATQTTNASGDYLFADLGPGQYFVEQAPATGRLQRSTETVKTVDISDAQSEGITVLTIDNFTDNTAAIIANSGTPSASGTTATTGANTVGDERDIVVNYIGGANNVEAQVNGGLLSVNMGAGTSGNAIITYDGVDGDANTLDHTNLILNLTASGARAFQLLAGSVISGGTLTIDVFSGAGNHSTRTISIPVTAGGAATEVVVERFSDFTVASGTGADFTNVTALRFQVNLNPSNDAQFDLTQTVAPFLSTQNFANLNPMAIGDRVWLDVDNNGLLDAGENGIANVALQLYEDTNSSGAFENGVDTLVDSTTATGTGNYQFDDLLPGNYLVVIPISNFGAGQPLVGHTASTGLNPVPAPNSDTNSDNNGVFLAGVGVVTTGAMTLTAGGEPDGAGGNANNRLDFGFGPQIDLEIDKTVNAATINAGQQVTYTLQVTNNGPGTAEDVVIVDNLPNFMTLVSVTAIPDGTVNQTSDPNGEVQVTYLSLASGATRTITIVASAPATQAATAVVTNSATVSGDGIDTDINNNTDTVDIAVTRNAVLQITKTDTPDPTAVGQPLNYQIVVSNQGPSTASNVVILDTLPAGLTFVSVASSIGTVTHNAGQITVNNIPTLNVGSQITVDISTTVQTDFAGSTIANSATADADEAALVTANASTNINSQVDLSITKADSVDPVNRGMSLTYTMVVTNKGPGAANNVEVVDTLPPDVTFVSAAGGTVTPPSGGNNTVTVNVGNIPNGEQRTVTITVNVAQTAAALLTNSAIVRSTETTAGFDPNLDNNSDTETTATQSLIDLAIIKLDSTNGRAVSPGQPLTYTLLVSNNGPSTATNVIVTDVLPAGLAFVEGASSLGTVTNVGQTVTANLGVLAAGATASITIETLVSDLFVGLLSNTATVTGAETDTNTANNISSVTTQVVTQHTGVVAGTKFNDLNGNGMRDTSLVLGDEPDVVFVIDVSDSASSSFRGTPVGDQNKDGRSNTILDAEVAGFIALNRNLVDRGLSNVADLSIVTFGDSAFIIDLDPTTPGVQVTTKAGADKNGNGIPDVEEALSGLRSSGLTNFERALQEAIAVLQSLGTAPENGNVIFLSDGDPTTGGEYLDESIQMRTLAHNVRAFGVGEGSQLDTLRLVDSRATIFTSTDELLSVFQETGSGTGTTQEFIEPGLAGVMIYIDLNNNGLFDPGEQSTLTREDDPSTPDVNELGTYRFTQLAPGTYVIREVVPDGFRQTLPGGSERAYSITLVANATSIGNDFGNTVSRATNSISGYVYVDVDNDGNRFVTIAGVQVPQTGLPNVNIQLINSVTGVVLQTLTGADGYYEFVSIPDGVYDLLETQPIIFVDGKDTQGAPDLAALIGTAINDSFKSLRLVGGVHATDYNFGERGLKPPYVTKSLVLASTPANVTLAAQYDTNARFKITAGSSGTLTIAGIPLAAVAQLYSEINLPLAIAVHNGIAQYRIGKGESVHLVIDSGSENPNAGLLTFTINSSELPGYAFLGANTNPFISLDVNGDNRVSAIDALLIINQLNSQGAGPLTSRTQHFVDVNLDGRLSALDALQVINHLNWRLQMESGSEGEYDPGNWQDKMLGSAISELLFDDLNAKRRKYRL